VLPRLLVRLHILLQNYPLFNLFLVYQQKLVGGSVTADVQGISA